MNPTHAPSPLWAGAAAVCINPRQKVWLSGYGKPPAPTDTAYLDLKLKALVVGDGRTTAAIITADLLNFDEANVSRFRGAIRRRTGIPETCLLLNASHTHTAPATCRIDLRDGSQLCEAYLADLEAWFAAGVQAALGKMERVRVSYGRGRCGVGINRRLKVDGRVEMRPNPEGPVDHEVAVLKVEGQGDGRLISLLATYACHPTTYSGSEIGGDFPGFMQAALERDLPGTVALFAQGCGGHTKPRHLGEDGRFRADRLEAAVGFGEDLARSVMSVLDGPMSAVGGPLNARESEVELPLDRPPTQAEARDATRSPSWWVSRWGEEMLRRMAAGDSVEQSVRVRVTVLAMGDLSLLGMGAEVFPETGMAIRRRMAPARTLTLAYTNGMGGYIATPQALRDGGYEVEVHTWWNVPSRFGQAAEETLIGHAVALAKGDA